MPKTTRLLVLSVFIILIAGMNFFAQSGIESNNLKGLSPTASKAHLREIVGSDGYYNSQVIPDRIGPTPTPTPNTGQGYVRRNGNQLTLNNRPYRFTGLNIYNANSINNCWYTMGTGDALNTALTNIDNGTGYRAKVIRAWFFQSLSTTNGVRDWTAFDHTIAVAKSKGFKVIPTLGNQWADCDGAWSSSSAGFKNEQWYTTNYATMAGTAPGLPQTYRDYVRDIVTRYKDEPAIAMWQLMNEAEDPVSLGGACSASSAPSLKGFADDMSALVKGIDPNHLLSLGTLGGGQCGAQGDQYQLLHSSPNIDLCEYHDYGFPTVAMPGDQWNGLQVRINQCNALGKPIFIGETGMTVADGGGSLQSRADHLEAKFAAQFAAGVVGQVVWAWGNLPSTGSYEITVGDPALAVIGRYGMSSTQSPFDLDGDGKTDIGIFRPSVGEWWINHSGSGNTLAFQFGASTDKIAPADFTGDGKTDIAFFRPPTGEWYILRSENNSFFSFPFGASEDIPVPADYDADGKADPAVFRPSSATWYIQRSSDNGTTIAQFGATGDHPVAADYDGDGKADLAIYRPSNGQWWLNRSTGGVIVYAFGDANDKTVQGDYTGDGKADVAFWRPSTGEWYILRSEDTTYYSAPFGISSDIPAPGDYDGDGKFDTTVFRPSNANWYSQRTTAGTLIQQFGANGDRPLPNAFVR